MRLRRDAVLTALSRLDRRLAPADLAELRRVANALDAATDETTVQAVIGLLYAEKKPGPEAANKAFERLRARLDDAAEAAGLALQLKVSGAKRLGVNRRVSFVGEVPIAATPDMREIEEVTARLSGELIDQRAAPYPPVVVVLTVNDNETQAVFDAFLGPAKQPSAVERGSRRYHELGKVGGYRVVHAQCEMGGLGAGERARQVIADWHPDAVLAVGVAFGVDRSRQAFGDVLVASQVVGYEMARVNKDGSRTLREPRYEAPGLWLQRARAAHASGQRAGGAWPEVHFGPILSGQKLVDNAAFRDQLVAATGGEAVGGEMEALGLVRACQEAPSGWLVIKGIADFADGSKPRGERKKRIQRNAALCAAWLARWVLDSESPTPLPDIPPELPARAPSRLPRTRVVERAAAASLAETKDFDDLRAAGIILENLAQTTALEPRPHAEDSGSTSRAATTASEGTSALVMLLGWLDNPQGPPYFAVLGEYGMGKTIVCQRLTRELEKRRKGSGAGFVPLYFDLKKLTGLRTSHVDASGAAAQRDRVPTLDEVLSECIERGWLTDPGVPKPTAEDVKRAVAQGALVIFDGLDEALVHLSEAGGQQLTDELLRILPPAGKGTSDPSRVLVSCRTHFFRSLREQHANLMERGRADRTAERFGALLLLPFTAEQVEEYLRHALPEFDTERALEAIRSVHDLGDLVSRPYLLHEIRRFVPRLEQWRVEGKKVQGVTLYRQIVRDWLDRDLGKTYVKPEHKLALAADLAAELWRRGQRLLPAGELESWFHNWRDAQADRSRRYDWIDRAKLEEDLRNSHFLVREDGASERESGFRFAHSSLAELFLAEHLLQAIREDRPERWAVAVPSRETLDFLGQMLVEEGDGDVVRRLGLWRAPYRSQTSELLLAFALDCYRKGRPTPVMRGIDLRGARLLKWGIGSRPQLGRPRLDLSGARFDAANLREAVLAGIRFEGASFAGARMERADIYDCQLDRADFAGARLHGANVRRCSARGANWNGAGLYRTGILHSIVDQTVPGMLPAPDARRAFPSGRRLALFRGHAGDVLSCAFSSDGASIVSGGVDGWVRVWDAASGEVRVEMKGHASCVWSCAFSPDRASIVSGGAEGSVRLWDAASGEVRVEMKGHGGGVRSCAFSSDGASIVSCGDDGCVRVWDAVSGEVRLELKGHGGRLRSCSFSPDGGSIVSGGDDGCLRVWDAVSGEVRVELKGHGGGVRSCSFSPDGGSIVSGGKDGGVRVWDVGSREVRVEMKGHLAEVLCCSFSPDGASIVSGGGEGDVQLWDAASGELRVQMKAHSGGARSCAFSSDGASIVSCGKSVRVWDAASGELRAGMKGYAGVVWSCAFSLDGASLVSGGADGWLLVWDGASGDVRVEIEAHADRVLSCAFSPDSTSIVSGGDDGWLRVWDAASGELRVEIKGHAGGVRSCAFSPDGASIVSGGEDGRVRLWDAASGEPRVEMKGHAGIVMSCAFSPNGASIVSGGIDWRVWVWDAASGEARVEIKSDAGGVRSCAFSPDGASIVSGGSNGSVRVWDAASGEVRAEMKGHAGWVGSCAFSPDGASIVSGGEDGWVRVWDTVSGEVRAEMKGHAGWVWSCAFLLDGTWIVSGADDGLLRVEDAKSGELLHVYFHRDRGSAAWDPRANRLLHARGEVWRDLRWVVPASDGGFDALPVETFGDLVEDWPDERRGRPLASAVAVDILA